MLWLFWVQSAEERVPLTLPPGTEKARVHACPMLHSKLLAMLAQQPSGRTRQVGLHRLRHSQPPDSPVTHVEDVVQEGAKEDRAQRSADVDDAQLVEGEQQYEEEEQACGQQHQHSPPPRERHPARQCAARHGLRLCEHVRVVCRPRADCFQTDGASAG